MRSHVIEGFVAAGDNAGGGVDVAPVASVGILDVRSGEEVYVVDGDIDVIGIEIGVDHLDPIVDVDRPVAEALDGIVDLGGQRMEPDVVRVQS